MQGQGDEQGTPILDMNDVQKTVNVHRAKLMKQILDVLPRDRLQAYKRLTKIEEGPSKITLSFEDRSETTVDAVIGADGIHSMVRKSVLRDSPSTIDPAFAGFWDMRTMVPVDEAAEHMGKAYFNPLEPKQYGWAGDGTFALHQILDDGMSAACILAVASHDHWDPSQWKQPVGKPEVEELLRPRGKFGEGLLHCLMQNPDLAKFSQWDSAMAPSYSKGSICIMGGEISPKAYAP